MVKSENQMFLLIYYTVTGRNTYVSHEHHQ